MNGDGSRLRALWVYKVFDVGGAERLLLELEPWLRPDVDVVPVAVETGTGEMARRYEVAELDPRTLGAAGEWDLRWVGRLRALVRRLRPDVVHFHAPYPAGVGRLGLLGSGVPIVVTEHNLWSHYHPATRALNAATYQLDAASIAVSEGVRDGQRRSALGRWATEGTLTVANGIDAERVRADADMAQTSTLAHPAYGTVGHLRRAKGIDVLLRASLLIRERLPDARGIVVGVGEDERALRRLRQELGADQVDFLGFRDDARALTGALDVFVVASREEGLPLAMLEAMALGRPVVATTAGGIPEVIAHGENGILVPIDDPSALASAVTDLLGSPEEAARLGEAGRRTVEERFSSRETARRYVEVYRRVTGRG